MTMPNVTIPTFKEEKRVSRRCAAVVVAVEMGMNNAGYKLFFNATNKKTEESS